MALLRIPESCLLEITTAILACNCFVSMASMIGCKEVPLVEPNTPSLNSLYYMNIMKLLVNYI